MRSAGDTCSCHCTLWGSRCPCAGGGSTENSWQTLHEGGGANGKRVTQEEWRGVYKGKGVEHLCISQLLSTQ